MRHLRATLLAAALSCALGLPAHAGQHDAPQLRTDGAGGVDLLGDTIPGPAGTPVPWRQCQWGSSPACQALPGFVASVPADLMTVSPQGVARTWAGKLKDQPLTPQDFGAYGDGVHDDTAAFQAMALAYNTQARGVYVPDGEYQVSQTTVLVPPALSALSNTTAPPAVRLGKRAHITATAPMVSVLQVGTDASDYSGLLRNGLVEGGVVDCNGLAQNGIYLPWVNTALVSQGEVRNCLNNFIKFGSSASPSSGYEGLFDHMKFTATWTNVTVTGITRASPAVVTTATPHGFVVGTVAYIQNVGGMTQINQQYCTVSASTALTFTCSNINSSAYSVYTSGGQTDKTVPTVSTCVAYVNTGDSQGSNSVGGGCASAVRAADALSGFDGKWTNNHFWNFPEQGEMTDCWYLRGDNQIVGNQCDGPFNNAYHLTHPGNHLIGDSVVYSGALAGRPNHANAVYLDTGAGAEIVAGNWKADDATKSIANGVAGDLTNLKVISMRCINVAAGCPAMQLPDLPTSATGLSHGAIWNNSGVVNVVP